MVDPELTEARQYELVRVANTPICPHSVSMRARSSFLAQGEAVGVGEYAGTERGGNEGGLTYIG